MQQPPPLLRCITRLPQALFLVAAMGCVAHDLPASAAAHGITEISIEHDCFGCASSRLLVLRSDGTAVSTQVGKARLGTQDEVQRGSVSRTNFDALAHLLTERGFFQMAATYQNPALQDGAWTIVRATRGNAQKEVFARDDAAPPDLRALEAAIDAAKHRIDFKP